MSDIIDRLEAEAAAQVIEGAGCAAALKTQALLREAAQEIKRLRKPSKKNGETEAEYLERRLGRPFLGEFGDIRSVLKHG